MQTQSLDTRWALAGLEHLDEMVMVTDAELDGGGPHIRYVNAAFERVTGWRRDEVLGRSPRFLQGPGTDRAELERLRLEMEHGRPARGELVNYARDGRPYRVRIRIQPIDGRHGRPVAYVALLADLSDQPGLLQPDLLQRDLVQREAMLQSFLEHCPGLAWIADEHGNALEANTAYIELAKSLGADGRLPILLTQMYPPDQAELYAQNTRRVALSNRPERVLEPSLHADGTVGMYESFKFPLGERDGVRLVGGIAIDMTEREGERQMADRLAAIVRSSSDAIVSLDLGGHIVSWNHGAEKLYGYSAAEAIGAHESRLLTPAQVAETEAWTAKVLAGEPEVRFETERTHRNGGRLHVQLSLSPIINREGRCVGISRIATDIGERHRREAQIRHFAEHDPVTGALNERGLLLATSRRIETDPARGLIMLRMEVDRHAELRDVFGVRHAAALLRQVVERLRGLPGGRPQDVALIGQNQFAVLLAGGPDDLGCLQARLHELDQAMATPMDVLGIEVAVRTRCGAALYPRHASGAEDLLRCADLAFGQARRQPGHGSVVYDPAMGEHVAYQVRLQHELRHALARGELRVVLQPIYGDALPSQVVGFEALARWRHPELGDIPPAEFIPVAEESGLIVAIGSFVLAEACRLKARLDAAGHDDLFLSVNVSRDQFLRGDLHRQVAAVLAETGVRGDRLELEITERLLMEPSDESERQVRALAGMGVSLVVDDFGIGYSNLAFLRRYPLSKLKVDRCFVTGLPDDPGAAEIVRTILALARSLGLQTLGEGVETDIQHEALHGIGCDQYQGFLFSRPLEADAVMRLMGAGAATRH